MIKQQALSPGLRVFTPGGEGSGGEKAARPLESAVAVLSKPGVSTHGDAGVPPLRFAKTPPKPGGRDAVERGERPNTSVRASTPAASATGRRKCGV